MNHFVLIGMPGSGKSTIARALSTTLSLPYLDGDAEIEKRTGEPLSVTLSRLGMEAFLRLEEETIVSLPLEGTVFAPGGSAVYSSAAMTHMKKDGLTIYLNVPLDVLRKRVGPLKQRGVVIPDGHSFEELYLERTPLYQRYADMTIDTEGLTVEEVLERLLSRITSPGNARS